MLSSVFPFNSQNHTEQFSFCQERKLNEKMESTFLVHLCPLHCAKHISVSCPIESSKKSRKETSIPLHLQMRTGSQGVSPTGKTHQSMAEPGFKLRSPGSHASVFPWSTASLSGCDEPSPELRPPSDPVFSGGCNLSWGSLPLLQVQVEEHSLCDQLNPRVQNW